MRKIFTLIASICCVVEVAAQYNPDVIYTEVSTSPTQTRKEIVLPEVNGYTIFKGDFHTHSIYSDGDVTPAMRVYEAWIDGLDMIAITEHIEYRRIEPQMLKFLKGYHGKKALKAINNDIVFKTADERGIFVDLNYAVEEAQKAARGYGMLVVPGSEITRHPVKIGHFNALFTTDNNAIYDTDPLVAMRNARSQGALIMHNHPGWSRKNVDKTEIEIQAYNEGLIDGVEVMNGGQFYPKIIDRAREENLFVSSNTDIHKSTFQTYGIKGLIRNMTFVFAKECTLESIKEALQSRRTLAFGGGHIAGDEQLLKDLFKASVKPRLLYKTKKNLTVSLTNNTSLTYYLRRGEKGIPIELKPFSAIIYSIKIKNGKKLSLFVDNMWSGNHVHPEVEFVFE